MFNPIPFLIVPNSFSKVLKEDSVKDVNLSTNFNNILNVEIFEYKPIGLFFYNNQLFYFSKNGKIIDKFREGINETLIIFYGNQASMAAYKFLNIIIFYFSITIFFT